LHLVILCHRQQLVSTMVPHKGHSKASYYLLASICNITVISWLDSIQKMFICHSICKVTSKRVGIVFSSALIHQHWDKNISDRWISSIDEGPHIVSRNAFFSPYFCRETYKRRSPNQTSMSDHFAIGIIFFKKKCAFVW